MPKYYLIYRVPTVRKGGERVKYNMVEKVFPAEYDAAAVEKAFSMLEPVLEHNGQKYRRKLDNLYRLEPVSGLAEKLAVL